MTRRRANPRLSKIHRNYTVDEVARLYEVHRNTVRQWLANGLPKVKDAERPVLILGAELAAFLTNRRAKRKRPCTPGEFFCMRCRAPRPAAGSMADYQPLTPSVGNLVALCAACQTTMYKRAKLTQLDVIGRLLEIRVSGEERHIDDSPQPSVNSDSSREALNHAKAQSS